jgi:hypothetical protein
MYCVILHNIIFSCWPDIRVDTLCNNGSHCYTVHSNGHVMAQTVTGGLQGAALHASGQRVHSPASNE